MCYTCELKQEVGGGQCYCEKYDVYFTGHRECKEKE